MSTEPDEQQFELRAYLLGKYIEEAKKEKIEEKLMLDEDYFQQLLLEEEDLIEDYIDDELDADEKKCFESHFLIPVERCEKVKSTLLLKKHREENAPVIFRPEGEKPAQKKWYDFIRSFLSPVPVVSVLAVAGIFLFLWFFYFSGSDSSKTVISSLNRAYAFERPLESRISEFNYAPFDKTRGQENSAVDSVNQNRAERLSLDYVAENPTAENQHLLARVYLAKKEFGKALKLLEEARKKSPQDAEILNDMGVAYLENSRTVTKDEEKLDSLAKALEFFDNALAIDENLLPARFNKAMATEVYLSNRAKDAWQEYLKFDQTSKWADEARAHLEALNKQSTLNISTAQDLEAAFRQAFRERNDETAFQIVSLNRELINGKYLPQRFAMQIVSKKKRTK
jgi:Flp pilus assembly protein TadD